MSKRLIPTVLFVSFFFALLLTLVLTMLKVFYFVWSIAIFLQIVAEVLWIFHSYKEAHRRKNAVQVIGPVRMNKVERAKSVQVSINSVTFFLFSIFAAYIKLDFATFYGHSNIPLKFSEFFSIFIATGSVILITADLFQFLFALIALYKNVS